MRFKQTDEIYKIYAVTGTQSIAFAIDCAPDDMKNLLGFTVEKEYNTEDNKKVRKTLMGFKVFEDRIQNPLPGVLYSTYDNPIQAFTWEDFSAYPDRDYRYYFTPLFGSPLNIERGKIISIEIKTEPTWKADDHSIFFNRGVASSQAYAMKFGNKAPDEIEGEEAYEWLSRGLKEALLDFIMQAQQGDKIYGCFYEFRHHEILLALRDAADRGVNLELIYDAKENGRIDKKTGKFIDSFPKVENEKACRATGLFDHSNCKIIFRERNKSYISHNKFMILECQTHPMKVWTGSTNISKGGLFGQANVGHVIDDLDVAKQFKMYWDFIKDDPNTASFEKFNSELQPDLTDIDNIKEGVTCIFSPRQNIEMLNFYAKLLDSAKDCACITLAFTVDKAFVKVLSDNTDKSAVTFLLLERDAEGLFDYVYKNNVVKAVGSFMPNNALYKWVRETNTQYLGINSHVKYIHSKFLLQDPLKKDCIVVTGSANFSKPSTIANDENMIIIKGNTRVADIYFTEFLRLFNHYYFRWIVTKLLDKGSSALDVPAFLVDNDSWTEQYRSGKYKRKRIEMFVNMDI